MNIRTKLESCVNIIEIDNIIKFLNTNSEVDMFIAQCYEIPAKLVLRNYDTNINNQFIHNILYLLLLPSIIEKNHTQNSYDEKIISMITQYIAAILKNRAGGGVVDESIIDSELSNIFEIIIFEDKIKKEPIKKIIIPQSLQGYYNKRFRSFLNFVIRGTADVLFDDNVEVVIDLITKIGYEKIHNELCTNPVFNESFYKNDCNLSKEEWLLIDDFNCKHFIFEMIRVNLIGETAQFISLSRYLKATFCDYYRENILTLSLFYSKKLNIAHDIMSDVVIEGIVSLNTTCYPSSMIALEMESKLLTPSTMYQKKVIDHLIDSIVMEHRNESVLSILMNDEPAIESTLKLPFNIEDSFDVFYDEALEASASGAKKNSVTIQQAQNKIYKAYKTYKNEENKIDSQLSKATVGLKNAVVGDSRKAIIEGKQFSPISILKKALGTVAIFSYSKIAVIVLLITRFAYKKSTTDNERRKLIMELDTEIELITEKIDDARGDGNKKAKYALMRTKNELQNAQKKIKFGIEADRGSINKAKSILTGKGGKIS